MFMNVWFAIFFQSISFYNRSRENSTSKRIVVLKKYVSLPCRRGEILGCRDAFLALLISKKHSIFHRDLGVQIADVDGDKIAALNKKIIRDV